jgi:predicted AAA+ superfamily ATPase
LAEATPKRKVKVYITREVLLPDGSCFLLGPRGTGKTMMLKKRFDSALYLDLLDPMRYRTLLANPNHLIELTDALDPGSVVIIDEIQKIPQLLDVVHLILEKKRSLRFLLTGSSARKLRSSGPDLLAGRAIEVRMPPFTADELVQAGVKCSLQQMLRHGMIPVVVDSATPGRTMATYVNLYLREEVLQEGLARRVDDFARFLEAISFSHGAQLNISNVARECQVARKTVEGYVGILKDLLIAHLVPVFDKRAKRQLASHPKFYFYDTGLFRELRPAGPLDRSEEIEGAALEGLVFQHLVAWCDRHLDSSHRIYFWRTKSGSEVDFVIYGSSVFLAVEVTNSAVIRPKDLRAIRTLLADYSQCKGIMLYRGSDTFVRDGITIMPIEQALIDPASFFLV